MFPHIGLPRNLHIVGRVLETIYLKKLYRNAKVVVMPITFLSISNRLLEALFHGKSTITTIYAISASRAYSWEACLYHRQLCRGYSKAFKERVYAEGS